jgi:hypothetical protein
MAWLLHCSEKRKIMKTLIAVSIFSVLLCSFPVLSQHTRKTESPAPKNRAVDLSTSRAYSFYDANRGGYIFVDKNGESTFVPVAPLLPKETKPVTTSLPLTRWLNLDLYPQLNYPNYTAPRHPAGSESPPIPIIKN